MAAERVTAVLQSSPLAVRALLEDACPARAGAPPSHVDLWRSAAARGRAPGDGAVRLHRCEPVRYKRFILDDEVLYKKRVAVVGDTYYHHSTADDNLFLPKSYLKQLDDMKAYDPDLYRIARKGRFGVNAPGFCRNLK